MRKFSLTIITVAVAAWSLPIAGAILEEPFQPDLFNGAEIRLIQRSLTLTGHYDGLWDGRWGPNSQSAFDAYIDLTGPRQSSLTNASVVSVMADAYNEMERIGWVESYLPDYGISIGLPMKLLQPNPDYDAGLSFESPDLAVSIWRTDRMDADWVHQTLDADARSEPYKVRNERRLVTAADVPAGTAYARSDLIDGAWTTVLAIEASVPANYVRYISSSIWVGDAYGSAENESVANLGRLLDEAVASLNPVERDAPPGGPDSTGTAFFVSPTHLVTNHHVVDQCTELTNADGRTLTILAQDPLSDLALLRYPEKSESYLTIDADREIELGTQVSALGYPLYGIINTQLTYTVGVVSATSGLQDDPNTFALTAPLHPGNSGGPVINAANDVVGVVVSGVSYEFAQTQGFLPQNYNFAIKGGVLTDFLAEHGIALPPAISSPSQTGISEVIRQSVTPVFCLN